LAHTVAICHISRYPIVNIEIGSGKMGICLTQNEADQLIDVSKLFCIDAISWPQLGKKQSFEAISIDGSQKFVIDINHFGRIELRALTFQNRYANDIILVRIDFGRKQHQNPDHQIIDGNHVHIYREGYNVAWAYDIEHIPPRYSQKDNIFKSNDDFTLFDDFCFFCHINSTNISQGIG
jgi:hypothetical protein